MARKGTQLTEEHKQHIREAKQTKKFTRKVINLTTGDVYESVKDAAEACNTSSSNIVTAIKRDLKANKCKFQYLEER